MKYGAALVNPPASTLQQSPPCRLHCPACSHPSSFLLLMQAAQPRSLPRHSALFRSLPPTLKMPCPPPRLPGVSTPPPVVNHCCIWMYPFPSYVCICTTYGMLFGIYLRLIIGITLYAFFWNLLFSLTCLLDLFTLTCVAIPHLLSQLHSILL